MSPWGIDPIGHVERLHVHFQGIFHIISPRGESTPDLEVEYPQDLFVGDIVVQIGIAAVFAGVVRLHFEVGT